MGTTVNGIYIPDNGESGWGTLVADNQRRLADLAVNVKANGALGDGVTNDTAAIQAAAVSSRTLFFPPGTYMVNNPTFAALSGLRLVGSGAGSILRPTEANNNLLKFQDCTDTVIENMAFDNRACTGFGGVNFFDCARVRVQGCRFYDSSVQASASDRYAVVFSRTDGTNSDVQFLDNHIADLQCEFDYVQGLVVSRNVSRNSKKTTAFGMFTPATGTLINSDIEISHNVIYDPDVSHGAITMVLDPDTTANHTFRGIRIVNNTIVYTGTVSNVGIKLGTVNTSQATSGNVFEDVEIARNDIIFRSSGAPTWAIYGAITATMTASRWRVSDNYIKGNALGSEYAIRIDRVTDGEIHGNTVLNVPFGIAEVSGTDVRIGPNRVEAGTTAYSGTFPQTYAVTNALTDRAYDANATTLDEVADVLGTLIADLRSIGVVR